MTLGAATRKAEGREEWRELVARSPVAPQRSTKTTGYVKVKTVSFSRRLDVTRCSQKPQQLVRRLRKVSSIKDDVVWENVLTNPHERAFL